MHLNKGDENDRTSITLRDELGLVVDELLGRTHYAATALENVEAHSGILI